MFNLPGFPLPSVFRRPGCAWGLGPSPRSVAWSAFRAGGLMSVLFRSSRRSFSSLVLVCSFGSWWSAASFAALWSRRLGVPTPVCRSGGGWSVSVPVALRSSRYPSGSGVVVSAAGGLRSLAAGLRSSGLWVAA